MPQTALRQQTDRPSVPHARAYGADTRCGEWGTVVVTQTGKPPLRFKGRRLSLHWRILDPARRLMVELWQRQAGGFVVAHSDVWPNTDRTTGKRLKNLEAAIDHLENLCVSPQRPFEASGDPLRLFADIHHRMAFDQQFAMLVGDALADWSMLPPKKKEKP